MSIGFVKIEWQNNDETAAALDTTPICVVGHLQPWKLNTLVIGINFLKTDCIVQSELK